MSLEGRCLVVTAGGAGIGRAIAEVLTGRGALVHVGDIDPDRVRDMQRPDQRLGATLADVGDERAVDHLFDEALDRFDGQLDGLVNNAGIAGPTGPLETMRRADWEATFRVNVHSAFSCLRRALPVMKARGSGSIVNIASTAGTMGYPLRTPYAAAKWALVGLTKSLAMELGPSGIRVNAVSPGSVSGPRMDAVIEAEAKARGVDAETVRGGYVRQTSLRTFVDAHDIAETVAFLCSGQGAKISGQVLAVDGHAETLATLEL